MADPLSDVLDLVRLRSAVYFLADFRPPWGMAMDAGPFGQFHVVVRGQCWFRADGEESQLSAGDVVVFPGGAGHALTDRPGGAVVPGRRVLEAQQTGREIFGSGEPDARLLCGHFEFDRGLNHPLLKELPAVLRVEGMTQRHSSWFDSIAAALVRETDSEAAGADVVVKRLAEVLFVQVLRDYLAAAQPTHGFLAAIGDQRLARSLRFMHQRFGEAITLDAIADAANMSRSSLAARFKDVLGQTPMAYVSHWRLLCAGERLKTTGAPVAAIAMDVGYGSEAAFGRAFKKQFDVSPGAFRRQHTAA